MNGEALAGRIDVGQVEVCGGLGIWCGVVLRPLPEACGTSRFLHWLSE
jgi:hypothetical protein